MSLSGSVSSTLSIALAESPDLGASSWAAGAAGTVATTLTDGAALNKASKIYADHATATTSYDLDGGALASPLGSAQAAFSRIVALRVTAAAANSAAVALSGDWILTKFLTPGGDTLSGLSIPIRPGGTFFIAAPDATGFAVTATTGDGLTVTVSGSDAFDIVIVGS